MFKLYTDPEKRQERVLELHYDKASQGQVNGNYDPKKHGVLKFWLKRLTGWEKAEVGQSAMTVSLDAEKLERGEKPQPQFDSGEFSFQKVRWSVKRHEGFELDDKDVEKISQEFYRSLDEWILSALQDAITDLSYPPETKKKDLAPSPANGSKRQSGG
tara:strand:+ start:2665 stop:3138 length:474 start_codon:yes stop_codon:yes gene_type:complete